MKCFYALLLMTEILSHSRNTSLYETLNLTPSATDDEIWKAYQKLSK